MLSVGAGSVGGQLDAPEGQFVVTAAAKASFWLSTIATVPLAEAKTNVVLLAPGIISDGAAPTP